MRAGDDALGSNLFFEGGQRPISKGELDLVIELIDISQSVRSVQEEDSSIVHHP